jgi:peptidoglycan/LPS O-acetylase OafA/YrhL
MSTAAPIRPKFNALTGYRSIAALLIVFYHSGFTISQLGTIGGMIQNKFNIGVPLFFVLSGFLITFRYENSFELKFKWFYTYMRNRFARIYPVYFAYVVLAGFVHKTWTFKIWFVHLFVLVGLANPELRKIPQAWSLTVEENFYLLAPLILYLFRKKRLFTPLVISLSIAFIGQFLFKEINFFESVFNLSDTHTMYRDTFFGRSLEFFSGAYLAHYLLKHPERLKIRKSYLFTGLGILGIFAVIALLILADFRFSTTGHLKLIELFIRATFIPLPATMLIYGLATEANIFSRILGSKTMVLMGESSYTLYLIHMGPISGIIYDKFHLGVVTGAIGLQLTSIAIFKCWEKPMNNLLRSKKLKRS